MFTDTKKGYEHMLETKNLTVIYDADKEERVVALNNVSLSLPDSGLIGIVGPSGSGKSTFMYCLATLKNATDGDITYNGKLYSSLRTSETESLRRNEFGFVFQRHFLVPYMSALDNVTVAGVGKKSDLVEKGKRLLTDMGIREQDFSKKPSKLSGGQRQRVSIARAMINDPKVIFADEPTASLDHKTAFMVMDVLKSYAKDRLVLVITHDHSILKNADRIIEIWDGKISNVKENVE